MSICYNVYSSINIGNYEIISIIVPENLIY